MKLPETFPAIKNGDEVLIRGTVSIAHSDGTAYVTLKTGQSVYTDLRNCELAIQEADAIPIDDLPSKTLPQLVKICEEEGITFQPNSNKASLVLAIRANRSTS